MVFIMVPKQNGGSRQPDQRYIIEHWIRQIVLFDIDIIIL